MSQIDNSRTDTEVLQGFGSWASKSAGTIYQAASDGFVVAYDTGLDNGEKIELLSDSSTPPTTVRQSAEHDTNMDQSICCPIKSGDYYKVVSTAGVPTVYFIPLT